MQEYDIYLPSTYGDGGAIDSAIIDGIKNTLVDAFGGYTHFPQRSEGAWRIGGVTFRDEVTILRVLDPGDGGFNLAAFKRRLESELRQESVLIVVRDVRCL